MAHDLWPRMLCSRNDARRYVCVCARIVSPAVSVFVTLRHTNHPVLSHLLQLRHGMTLIATASSSVPARASLMS